MAWARSNGWPPLDCRSSSARASATSFGSIGTSVGSGNTGGGADGVGANPPRSPRRPPPPHPAVRQAIAVTQTSVSIVRFIMMVSG
jgi:hypothetical protein